MKYISKRIISFVVSLFMVLGLTLTPTINVFAETVSAKDGQEYEITQEMKDKIYEEARARIRQEDNQKIQKETTNKFGYFNDNLPEKNQRQFDPNEKVRFIVELDGKAVKDYTKGKSISEIMKTTSVSDEVLKSQKDTINRVTSINSNIELKNQYSVLLNGFSVEAQYEDMDEIAKMPGVKSVQVANVYYADMNNAGNMKTKISEVWENYGYDGAGMVVSIIDSGLDYTHKDMILSDGTEMKLTNKNPEGPGRYFTDKVPYGYNFADDNQEVIPAPGTSMHGMHVAGIVGANGADEEIASNEAVKGMAPEVQLLAMKVFSNSPADAGAYSDDVIAAIEDSVVHGADVINMSLGSIAGFQDVTEGEQKAIKEATENGVVVVVSAGNSQYSTAPYKFIDIKDTGLVGAPGVAFDSLQVASYENTNVTTYGLDYSYDGGNSKIPVPYTQCNVDPIDALSNSNGYEVVECGLGGTAEDFEGKDLTGKIALIKRGAYNFTDKQANAKAAGAIGVIIYNDEARGDSLIHMVEAEGLKIPALFIGNTDGAKIKELISKNVRIKFNGSTVSSVNPSVNDMSDFSSWGPAPNLDFKPQITGVGGNVWSTVNDDKYESMSGTSMAAPYVAGCTAIIMQHVDEMVEEGKLSFETQKEKVEFVKTLAMNTAEVKMDKFDATAPYSPRRQGAGLIDTEAAITNEVTLTYNGQAAAALKEMSKITNIPLKLHNYSDKTITYNVKDINGVFTEQSDVTVTPDGEILPYVGYMSYDIPLEGATITFDKEVLTVTTGSSIEFMATIKMDKDTPVDNFAEGYIRLIPEDSSEPEIGIPYMGFYGEWDQLPILDAPMYDDTSVLGEGSLFTLDDDSAYYLGVVGEDEDGAPIIDPECFAINPDDEDANNNVIPLISFLRNAKEFEINIIDDNGKIIRQLDKESSLRKEVLADQEGWYSTDLNWVWDGKTFSTETGEMESVEEGQYYLSMMSRIDFEGAQYQELKMPVKIDKTAPQVSTPFFDASPTAEYKLAFGAIDELSKVKGFAVMIEDYATGDNTFVETVDGGIIFSPEDYYNPETEQYEIDIILPYEINVVAPVVLDYAGNMGQGMSLVFNDAMGPQINIISPEFDAMFNEGEEINIEYQVSEELFEKTDAFFIVVDGSDQPINNNKNLSYTLTGIDGGYHEIDVLAVAGEEVIDSTYVSININGKELAINFDNLAQGMITNEDVITLSGTVTSIPKEFKINGEDVKVGIQSLFGDQPLAFVHEITLESGKLNKVDIYAKDMNDVEQHYAYNVYCDTEAPRITLTQPEQLVDNPEQEVYEVIVDENAETYTVSGKINDNLFGYKLYINGEQVMHVERDNAQGIDIEREFSQEIALESQVTTIKLQATDLETENTAYKTIIVYKGEKIKPITIENLTGTDKFSNGQQAWIKIRVNNIIDTEQTVTLIYGLFNEADEMVYVMANTQTINGQDNIVFNAMMNMPESGEYTLKCAIWDTIESQTPMSNLITFDISK